MKKILFLMAVFSVAVMGGELHDAARNGDLETIKKLATPSTINSLDDNERSVLSCAAANGQLDVVKWLLKHGADPNLSNWQSPLSQACFYGHYDVARILLENGADPNFTTHTGATPLSEAVDQTKGAKMVELLIAYGADVSWLDRNTKGTLLHKAAYNCEPGMVQLLLEQDMDPNALASGKWCNGWTPLYFARDEDSAILLLNAGADPNHQAADGFTPLMQAAVHDRKSIVSLLLARGADPAVEDNTGKRAVDFAFRNGSTEICRLLGEKSGAVDVRELQKEQEPDYWESVKGSTTRRLKKDDLAEKERIRLTIVSGELSLLKQMSLNMNQLNQMLDNYLTPLHLASFTGKTEIVRWLLEQGVDVSIRVPKENEVWLEGLDALGLAIQQKHEHVALLLIEAGAPLDRTYVDGQRLLHGFCFKGMNQALAAYIRYGGDIHYSLPNGTTPLMLAVKGGYAEVVKILLENGADPGAKVTSGPMKGRTALDYARDLGYDEITNLLTAASSPNSE